MLQDEFARLMNEFPKVERVLDDISRTRAEMAIIKSRFNMLSPDEMGDVISTFDRHYNTIKDLVIKVEIYQEKIYDLANRMNVADFDGYDDKSHNATIKFMNKTMKDAYSKQKYVEYEEDIKAGYGNHGVDEDEEASEGIIGFVKKKLGGK